MGMVQDIELPSLIETAGWLAERVGHAVPAMLGRAGLFPPSQAA
jgi:hypothetical protein